MNPEPIEKVNIVEVRRQANRIPVERRMDVIRNMHEVKELQPALKELFTRIDPTGEVIITHGREEFGKDLVLIYNRPLGREVYGVLVKRGDISGKTSSDIDVLRDEVLELSAKEKQIYDEIISQANQGNEYPADVNTHVNKLPLTGIWVCLSGNLSKNARKRLRREINKLVKEIWDISWLAEKFTEHYPEIFFDAERLILLDSLINRYRRHISLGNAIDAVQRPEVFVEPDICSVKLPGMATGEIEQSELDSINRLAERKKTPFSSLRHALRDSQRDKQRVLITGDMGSGKSGALTNIAIEMCQLSHAAEVSLEASCRGRESIEMPVLLNARDFLPIAGSVNELMNFFFKDFEAYYSRIRINSLLIDGLDELPPSDQAEVIERARSIAATCQCSLIIASRPTEFVNVPPLGFVKYEILPFEIKDALMLFKRLSPNDEMLKNLRMEMSQRQFNMPTTPLSLMLLAKIAEQSNEVPSTITELYRRYTEAALGRFDMERGISVLFDYKVKTLFLMELAYACFQQKDLVEISRDDFHAFVTDHARRQGVAEGNLLQFSREIERAGLLVFSNISVKFANRSFLDFFSATYLHENREDFDDIDQTIADLHFDPVWEEVSFFYVGLKARMGSKLIKRILEYNDPTLFGSISKVRIGRLLQAGYYTELEPKREAIRRAVTLLPLIRQQYTEAATQNTSAKLPMFMFYFVVMGLAEHCFRSALLRSIIIEIIDEHGANPTAEGASIVLPLLCALKDQMPKDDFRQKAQPFVNTIAHMEGLTPTERAASMMMLKTIYQGDSLVVKSMSRQLSRLRTRNPESFIQLFYPKRFSQQNLLRTDYAKNMLRRDGGNSGKAGNARIPPRK